MLALNLLIFDNLFFLVTCWCRLAIFEQTDFVIILFYFLLHVEVELFLYAPLDNVC